MGIEKTALNHLNNGGRMGAVAPVSSMFSGSLMDSQQIQDNMAFLVGELEKIDPRLLEPLTSFTYPRDIALKNGGGWVQYASTIDIDYGTTGGNEFGIMAPSATEISRIQANFNKDIYKVLTFLQTYSVGFVNNQLVQQTGRSLEEIFDRGIRLTYNKALDKNTYVGFTSYGTTGLLNNPNIETYEVEEYTAGNKTWELKTADEILADINGLINVVWENAEYSLDGLINHILLPPVQFGLLVSKKVSEAGNVSVLQYVLENNLAKQQGVDLKIFPCRWCIGAGTGGTDLMFGYNNDERFVNIDVTVPLARAMTAPNISNASIDSIYASQFSEVKFQYLQTAASAYGI